MPCCAQLRASAHAWRQIAHDDDVCSATGPDATVSQESRDFVETCRRMKALRDAEAGLRAATAACQARLVHARLKLSKRRFSATALTAPRARIRRDSMTPSARTIAMPSPALLRSPPRAASSGASTRLRAVLSPTRQLTYSYAATFSRSVPNGRCSNSGWKSRRARRCSGCS
jgi:hypothetical protein